MKVESNEVKSDQSELENLISENKDIASILRQIAPITTTNVKIMNILTRVYWDNKSKIDVLEMSGESND